jgi:hypothetical protein
VNLVDKEKGTSLCQRGMKSVLLTGRVAEENKGACAYFPVSLRRFPALSMIALTSLMPEETAESC